MVSAFYNLFQGYLIAVMNFNREKFLEKEAMGLVKLPEMSIISEYKVIREILWQLWIPHSSAVFEFDINHIKTRNNITIASIRSVSCLLIVETKIKLCL